MVVGRRRRRRDYPLNIRFHGYTCRELYVAQRCRRYARILMQLYTQRPSTQLRIMSESDHPHSDPTQLFKKMSESDLVVDYGIMLPFLKLFFSSHKN